MTAIAPPVPVLDEVFMPPLTRTSLVLASPSVRAPPSPEPAPLVWIVPPTDIIPPPVILVVPPAPDVPAALAVIAPTEMPVLPAATDAPLFRVMEPAFAAAPEPWEDVSIDPTFVMKPVLLAEASSVTEPASSPAPVPPRASMEEPRRLMDAPAAGAFVRVMSRLPPLPAVVAVLIAPPCMSMSTPVLALIVRLLPFVASTPAFPAVPADRLTDPAVLFRVALEATSILLFAASAEMTRLLFPLEVSAVMLPLIVISPMVLCRLY